MTTGATTTPRKPLHRDRIIQAAVDHADEHGIEALSMRKLGQRLGVEAMSLYNHVGGKDDIYDGMIDFVFAEIGMPPDDADWKTATRAAAVSAKDRFAAHSWVVPLAMSRPSIGPATLRFMESIFAILRRAGFDAEMTVHAWHALGSHVMGYAFQDANSQWQGHDHGSEMMERQMAREFPHVAELASRLGDCDQAEEFGFGLDLIIDGLEARLASAGT